jgi:hypothetical protein
MYIICAIITIPVGILGYFVVPGTIDQPNPYIFKEKDLIVARKRLDKAGHTLQGRLRFHHVKEIMTSKHFWMNSGAFLLWLKSLKKYDSPTVNSYGSIPSAIGIFLVLFVNFSSDLLWGPVWGITFASSMNSLSNLILVSALPGFHCPSCYTTLTHISPAHMGRTRRRKVVRLLQSRLELRPLEQSLRMGQQHSPRLSRNKIFHSGVHQYSTAWTNILTYPTTEAPRFLKGYAFSFSMSTSLIIGVHLLNLYLKREK